MHINHLLASLSFSVSCLLGAAEPLLVYSHRHYESDTELFEKFTEETGIPVEVVKAKANALIERLKAEGDKTKADLFITADAGRLGLAKDMGLLEPVSSPVLEERIPATYRDPDGHWYGFTLRARVFVVSPKRIGNQPPLQYEDLVKPEWKGRVLSRSSSNIYSQSLMASMIAAHGQEEARAWAEGLRKNFARPPQGNDRDQIRAVAAGLADVAIVNTYYVGLLNDSPEKRDRDAVSKVQIIYPNQENRGTHVNVSGGGVVKGSPQKEDAIKLLEFLASEEAQKSFPNGSREFPVVPGTPLPELQASWGDFKADELPLSKLGELNAESVKLMNEAGWQ